MRSARTLWLSARRGHTLVFGAGGHGMMGAAARGAYEMGGKIIGVVPYFFNTPGILFEHCTELIRMETMAERKTIMEERSDAFIALPGGIGDLRGYHALIPWADAEKERVSRCGKLLGTRGRAAARRGGKGLCGQGAE